MHLCRSILVKGIRYGIFTTEARTLQMALNATSFIISSIILPALVISDALYPPIKVILNFCIENSEGFKGIRFFINKVYYLY